MALEHRQRSSEYNTEPFAGIIGTHPRIVRARKIAERVARGDSNVLLYGETGTGKEIFARAIHDASPRAKGPFIPINCAAIPEALMESELFGYEPGSFTGALSTGKVGMFEAAARGTIFLDEICDMSPMLQAKLLRVLQERKVQRIGGTRQISIDVRFITATNQDLEELVEEGLFRADLYYRLNVVTIHLPPLRERLSDVELLVNHFIPLLNLRCNASVTRIHPEVIRVFRKYHWPGNVRELQNALEHALNFSDGNELRAEHLPPRILDAVQAQSDKNRDSEPAEPKFDLTDAVLGAEKSMLLHALERCKNNRTKTAKYLGIARSTLYEKLEKHGIYCEEPEPRSQLRSLSPAGRRQSFQRSRRRMRRLM